MLLTKSVNCWLGDAAADDAVVRLVALADPSPIERPVDEVGAEDHADVVELEALRGVDAADLVDPPRVARPEVGLRDAGRRGGRRRRLAFQGIDQSPTLTSGSSSPASSGSDQGQQKPATSRAVAPSPALPRISVSSSLTEPTIRKSNSSSVGQRTCGVRSSSSVLSTHWMNESEPFERNCASSSNSRTSSERLAAASRIRSVLPTSPGRTTCRSSMKKTETRRRVEDVVDLGLARARLRGREAAGADRPDPVRLVEDRRRRAARRRSRCRGST